MSEPIFPTEAESASEPEFDELENAKAARALALLIYHGLASIPPESLPPDWQAGYQAGACHELGA